MDFYFTDRKFNLLGVASTSGSTDISLANEEDKLSIEDSVRTLAGSLFYGPESRKQAESMSTLGNYVLYKDESGRSVWTTIMEINNDPLAGECVFLAEDAGVDLINELVGPYEPDKAYPIASYISRFTYDSGFKIGINEISNLSRKLPGWESDESTALARILSVATQFDNAELEFRFEVNGLQVVERYIDIFKKRGKDERVTLYVDKDINRITTSGNIYDLGTSLVGIGGTPEGQDNPINLKGYKYTDPDGRYILGSDGIMRDTVAVQKWSRLLSNDNPTPTSSHIQRRKTYETTDQKTLCDDVLRDLKKMAEVELNYEAEIVSLPYGVKIGDTIYLVDEQGELYLSARVLELVRCYSEDRYLATLGNYLIKDSGVDVNLQEIADKLKDQIKPGDTYYPWTRYADDANGTGMSSVPDGKTYMATIHRKNDPIASDNPEDYAGQWVKIKGENGSDGEDGKDGDQGPQGEPGPPGADGQDGLPGKDGVGVTSTAITYAQSTSGTTAPTSGWTTSVPNLTKGRYLWTRTIWTYTDNSTETGYTVSYNAKDGNNGTDGIAGKDGVGITSTLVEYAKSTSGTTKPTSGWSTTIPSVPAGQYLWTRTTWSYTDSTSEQGFSVAKMGDTGSKGDDGADGIGIANTKTDYQLHTSATTPPTGTWVTSPPAITVGKYLWTRTILEYTDGTKATPAYSVSGGPGANGSDGQNGAPGVDALPVFSGYVTNEAIVLVATNSGTVSDFSKATGTFVTYLGQDQLTSGVTYSRVSQSGVTATINQTTGAYSVTAASADTGMVVFKAVYQGIELQKIVSVTKAKQGNTGATGPKGSDGKDGANGVKGDPGTNGVSSYLHTAWKMADGTFTITYPGENLLPDSDATSLTKVNAPYNRYFSDGSAVGVTSVGFIQISDSKTPSGYVIEAIGDGSGNGNNNRGICWYSNGGTIKLEIGKSYTMSCYARLISGASTMRFQYGIGPYFSTRIPVDSASWKQYSWTFVAQQDSTRIYMPAGSGLSGTAQFCGFKLEEGSTATPWTPAPAEDYSLAYPKYRGEYTDTVEADSTDPNRYTWTAYLGEQGPPTGVISQSTVPSSPYVGMLWQNTGNVSGYISNATYRWNGSAWEIYQFTAQNILAETFTGFVFQGVEFIGSVFLNVFDITYDDGSRTTGRTEIKDGTIDMRSSSFDSDGNTTESTVITLSPVMGVSFSNSSFYGGGVKFSSEARFITGGVLLSDSTDPIDRDAILTSNTVNLLMTQGWLLWQGTWLCGSGTAYPDLPLTECFNGWALVFSEYANGAASDSGFNIAYISKQYVQAHNGKGTVIPITTYGETATSKYLYFTNTEIRSNSKNSAGNSGKYVLREVYAW